MSPRPPDWVGVAKRHAKRPGGEGFYCVARLEYPSPKTAEKVWAIRYDGQRTKGRYATAEEAAVAYCIHHDLLDEVLLSRLPSEATGDSPHGSFLSSPHRDDR
jgi:hypothetical protein